MYTNKTEHYQFPQYVATDFPSILVDVNQTYAKIDELLYQLETQSGGSSETIHHMETEINNLKNSVNAIESVVATLTADVDTLKGQMNNDTDGVIKQLSSIANSITDLNRRVTALEH